MKLFPSFVSICDFLCICNTVNQLIHSPILELIADNKNATHFEVATLVNQVVVALNTAHASALNLGITSDDIVDTSAISDALADVIDVGLYKCLTTMIMMMTVVTKCTCPLFRV